MTIVDSIITFFDPQAGLKRAQARAALDAVRKYDAATKGRRGASWRSAEGSSANQDMLPYLKIMRDRSRDLVRNNSNATNAVRQIANRVVGTGIRPAIVGLKSGDEAKVKQLWKDWAENTDCDFDERSTFYGLQKLVVRTVAESGSCLIVRRRVRGKVPIQLQVLEPDYLDRSKDTYRTSGEEYVLGGIKFSKEGKRQGYWLYTSLPSETGVVSSEFFKKEDVIHVFDVLRPGQIDGAPMGVSSFMKMRDLDDYEDAQLVKQKVAACLTVIVSDTSESFAGGTASEVLPDRLEPGGILNGGPGKDYTVVNPPSTEGYTDYTRSIKHDIAAAYGVTYASMTGDLTQVNFSSGKMGENNQQMMIEDLQINVMVPQFCNKVWQWFISAVELRNDVPKGVTCTWTTPRKQMIDPVKETKAISEALRNGIGSWSEVVREMGYDPDELRAELLKDKAMWDSLGLNPLCDPRFDAARPVPTADTPQA